MGDYKVLNELVYGWIKLQSEQINIRLMNLDINEKMIEVFDEVIVTLMKRRMH